MKYTYKTKIGYLTISEENDIIVEILFGKSENLTKENNALKKAINEINEFLDGNRKEFTFPFQISGTEFQQKVYNELLKIPYGQTCSYKDIAKSIGNEKASRAVGNANNKNKLPIVIPCHRVIGKNKDLTGYAGGFDIKEFLLNLENK